MLVCISFLILLMIVITWSTIKTGLNLLKALTQALLKQDAHVK
jgi:hypothetical protein